MGRGRTKATSYCTCLACIQTAKVSVFPVMQFLVCSSESYPYAVVCKLVCIHKSIDLMQIWRLLISINRITSTKEMNPITRKSMSKAKPSFRAVGQTHAEWQTFEKLKNVWQSGMGCGDNCVVEFSIVSYCISCVFRLCAKDVYQGTALQERTTSCSISDLGKCKVLINLIFQKD